MSDLQYLLFYVWIAVATFDTTGLEGSSAQRHALVTVWYSRAGLPAILSARRYGGGQPSHVQVDLPLG